MLSLGINIGLGQSAGSSDPPSFAVSTSGGTFTVTFDENDDVTFDIAGVGVFGPYSEADFAGGPIFFGTPVVSPVVAGEFEADDWLECVAPPYATTGTGSVVITRQWKRDASDITAMEDPTYQIVTADEGKAITCAIVATDSNGPTSADSNAIDVASTLHLFTETWSYADDLDPTTLPIYDGAAGGFKIANGGLTHDGATGYRGIEYLGELAANCFLSVKPKPSIIRNYTQIFSLRQSADGQSWVGFEIIGTSIKVYTKDSGSLTTHTTLTYAVDDVVRMDLNGTVYTVTVNDVLVYTTATTVVAAGSSFITYSPNNLSWTRDVDEITWGDLA